MSVFFIIAGVLERDGEGTACVLKIFPETVIEVSSLGAPAGGNKFKRLPETIFGHFLLCLPQFSELVCQQAEHPEQTRITGRDASSLHVECIIFHLGMVDQKFDHGASLSTQYMISESSWGIVGPRKSEGGASWSLASAWMVGGASHGELAGETASEESSAASSSVNFSLLPSGTISSCSATCIRCSNGYPSSLKSMRSSSSAWCGWQGLPKGLRYGLLSCCSCSRGERKKLSEA